MADYFIDPGIIYARDYSWEEKGRLSFQTAVKLTNANYKMKTDGGRSLVLVNGEIYEAAGLSWRARGMLAYHYLRLPAGEDGGSEQGIPFAELTALSPDTPQILREILAEIKESVFSNRFVCGPA